jgi:signal peptidase I
MKPVASWTCRVRTAVWILFVAVLLGSVACAGVWLLGGGRWYIVRTPSMGTAAPVGTLLWVQPVDYSTIHVGDFITFQPPGSSTTYSHRVIAIETDGTLRTKGDANSAPDTWTLTKANVIGKVDMRWWAVGWLVRAAPIVIGGALLLWLLVARFTPRPWRSPVAIVGAAVLVSVSTFVLRPLVGAERIALIPTGDGVRATYISTGLLPLHLRAAGGAQVDLRNGQTGSVFTNHLGSPGGVLINLDPNIAWWFWICLVGVCFLPAMTTSLFGSRALPVPKHSG